MIVGYAIVLVIKQCPPLAASSYSHNGMCTNTRDGMGGLSLSVPWRLDVTLNRNLINEALRACRRRPSQDETAGAKVAPPSHQKCQRRTPIQQAGG